MVQVSKFLGLHGYEVEQVIVLVLILHFIANELLDLAEISNALFLLGFEDFGEFDLDIWESSKIEDILNDL